MAKAWHRIANSRLSLPRMPVCRPSPMSRWSVVPQAPEPRLGTLLSVQVMAPGIPNRMQRRGTRPHRPRKVKLGWAAFCGGLPHPPRAAHPAAPNPDRASPSDLNATVTSMILPPSPSRRPARNALILRPPLIRITKTTEKPPVSCSFLSSSLFLVSYYKAFPQLIPGLFQGRQGNPPKAPSMNLKRNVKSQ